MSCREEGGKGGGGGGGVKATADLFISSLCASSRDRYSHPKIKKKLKRKKSLIALLDQKQAVIARLYQKGEKNMAIYPHF